MQGCTIAVMLTGGDRVESYIEGDDARRAIVCVAPDSFPGAV